MNNRKLVLGFGINDANYTISKKIGTKRKNCHFYSTWTSMLVRCYSENALEKAPAYKGCSVHEDWRSFMRFREWMIQQDYEGKQRQLCYATLYKVELWKDF